MNSEFSCEGLVSNLHDIHYYMCEPLPIMQLTFQYLNGNTSMMVEPNQSHQTYQFIHEKQIARLTFLHKENTHRLKPMRGQENVSVLQTKIRHPL